MIKGCAAEYLDISFDEQGVYTEYVGQVEAKAGMRIGVAGCWDYDRNGYIIKKQLIYYPIRIAEITYWLTLREYGLATMLFVFLNLTFDELMNLKLGDLCIVDYDVVYTLREVLLAAEDDIIRQLFLDEDYENFKLVCGFQNDYPQRDFSKVDHIVVGGEEVLHMLNLYVVELLEVGISPEKIVDTRIVDERMDSDAIRAGIRDLLLEMRCKAIAIGLGLVEED